MNKRVLNTHQKNNDTPLNAGKNVTDAVKPKIVNNIPLQFSSFTGRPPSDIQLTPQTILYLHRKIGNKAVGQLIQAKLKIGQPGDKYEQEADRVADQVMRMPVVDPSGNHQTKPGVTVSNLPRISRIQRVCAECEEEMQRQPMEEEEEELQMQPVEEEQEGIQRQPVEEEKELQMQPVEEEEEMLQGKATDGGGLQISNQVQSQIDSLRGGGQPLPESVRTFFEPRFNSDFSGVRAHTHARAAETAKAINARAFTAGKDVAFGSGQYSPDTSEGKKLLAHELTHVVQQTGSVQSQQNIRTSLNDSWEITSGGSAASDLLPPSSRTGDNRAIFRKEIDDFRQTHSTDSATMFGLRPLANRGAGSTNNQAPNVQRQHKLETDLGSAAGVTCPISTAKLSHPDASLQITFDLGGSTLTPQDINNIAVFVNNWHNVSLSVPVRIHGYASKDGPPTVNWPLSCRRAEAVSKQMQRVQPAVVLSTGKAFPAGKPGIPAGFTQVFAHGETEEFSKTALPPNRRAMVHLPTLPSLPGKVAKAPSAKLKSGPTYTPNGTIKATRTKTTLSANFKMAAEFDHDPAKGIHASCGEIRQYIRWSNNNVDPSRFRHEGFLTDKTYLPNTWYEDRHQENWRYGHRRGPHSFSRGAHNQYLDATGGSQDFLNGKVYEGTDAPNTFGSAAYITSFVGTWEFRLDAIDVCNGNKVLGQDNAKVVW
jgi:outer membrane protein OmpA-like peptidoglycan-associated protein